MQLQVVKEQGGLRGRVVPKSQDLETPPGVDTLLLKTLRWTVGFTSNILQWHVQELDTLQMEKLQKGPEIACSTQGRISHSDMAWRRTPVVTAEEMERLSFISHRRKLAELQLKKATGAACCVPLYCQALAFGPSGYIHYMFFRR